MKFFYRVLCYQTAWIQRFIMTSAQKSMILHAHRIYIELEPTNKDVCPLTERPYLRFAARHQQISLPVSFSVLSYVRAAAIQTIYSGLCAPVQRSPPVHLRFFCPARPPSSPSTPLSCRVETPLPSNSRLGSKAGEEGGAISHLRSHPVAIRSVLPSRWWK